MAPIIPIKKEPQNIEQEMSNDEALCVSAPL